MRGVHRQVGDGHPRAHDGRLVAHGVTAAQEVGPLPGVPHVHPVRPVGHRVVGAVRLGQQHVDPDHVVAVGLQRGAHRGADEAGRPGDQDPHDAATRSGRTTQVPPSSATPRLGTS